MAKKNEKPFGVLKIAAAYIGTVVGAGFASGQEVLRFFSAYGLAGIIGIAVSALLFFFIGYTALLLGRNLHAVSHMEVIRHTNGKLLGLVIDMIVTVFLFGGLCTMLAGSGAIFAEQFAISPLWGSLAMMAAALMTVLTGTRGVISANGYIVPFMIVAMLYVSVKSLAQNPVTAGETQAALTLAGATPHWLLSAVNYASYNIVVSVGVLAPIGASTPDKRRLFWGALLGAAGLSAGMLAVYFCLLTNMTVVRGAEIPMLIAARRVSSIAGYVFPAVLLAAVYTTAVGNLYAFSQRLTDMAPKTAVIVVTSGLAILVAQLGFSNMVRFLYPAVGYGGMLLIGGVVYTWIRKRDSLR